LAGQPDDDQVKVMNSRLIGSLRLPRGALVFVAGMIMAPACGDDSDAESEVSDVVTRDEPETEPTTDAETTDAASTLQRSVFEAAEFAAEVVTADGTLPLQNVRSPWRCHRHRASTGGRRNGVGVSKRRTKGRPSLHDSVGRGSMA